MPKTDKKNNLNQENLKKEADKLMKFKGNTRGSEILSLARYVKAKYGKEGLEKLEKKMEEIGYPLHFNEIKPARWYPEAQNNLAMITAKEIFGWKDLFELGYNCPTFSFGVRVFMKLASAEKVFQESAKTWKKFVDVGTLEPYKFNEKEKYIILRFKDYRFHPLMCPWYAGFFLKIGEYVIKGEKLTIEETKCIHKGDPYHEYVIKWE